MNVNLASYAGPMTVFDPICSVNNWSGKIYEHLFKWSKRSGLIGSHKKANERNDICDNHDSMQGF